MGLQLCLRRHKWLGPRHRQDPGQKRGGLYGSDQAASLEVDDLMRLVKDVRTIEVVLGDGIKRLSEKELATKKKLRG